MGTGQCFRHVESWTARATAHADMGQLWTGTTRFLVRTGNDTTKTTTANTTTTAKERRGSELGLALRGGGRLLGLGVALRCSGSRPEAGGHGAGYQRETRKRSRSLVGWAPLVTLSTTACLGCGQKQRFLSRWSRGRYRKSTMCHLSRRQKCGYWKRWVHSLWTWNQGFTRVRKCTVWPAA